MKHLLVAGLVAGLAGVGLGRSVSPALAGFSFDGSAPAPEASASVPSAGEPAARPYEGQSGEVDGAPVPLFAAEPASQPASQIAQGFGSNIPLELAVRQIVPGSLGVRFAAGTDPARAVTWRGGRPWAEVLRLTLAQSGHRYDVENEEVVVSVNAPTQTSLVPAGSTQAAALVPTGPLPESRAATGVSSEPAPGQAAVGRPVDLTTPTDTQPAPPSVESQTTLPRVAPPAPIEAARSWRAMAGSTLRETLNGWAREEGGWGIVWDSDLEYEIVADHTFTGSFKEAAADLIRAFAKAEPPVYGTIYSNNVIRIVTSQADLR